MAAASVTASGLHTLEPGPSPDHRAATAATAPSSVPVQRPAEPSASRPPTARPTKRPPTPRAGTPSKKPSTTPSRVPKGCSRGRIALTFDDGPDVQTRQVLRVLKRFDVRATFFVTGSKATADPAAIRAIHREGHHVQNHSWSHPDLTGLSAEQIRRELIDTQRAVAAAGVPAPAVFRPPFGASNATVETEVERLGLRTLRWSIDSFDWRGGTPQEIAATVLKGLRRDGVVLMHDGVRNSVNTARALPLIIDGLQRRGFCTAG
ncbi:polysaccharide deacetylase family protein [Actinomadura sp. 6N118]|uniref:polysaccharide deacetylase family protein n=1 Tax=Actinomadura sp. 6N118 TaxID=3375151 RepID=UPI0037BB83AA